MFRRDGHPNQSARVHPKASESAQGENRDVVLLAEGLPCICD
jgi:hypothetical protein